MPEDTVDYYIVECGVNPDVYDWVTVNDEEIHGTPTLNPGRKDYATSKATLEERPEVDYDNHVSDGAMRTLSFDKWLYDSDGNTQLNYPDDESLFNFRIYLGSDTTSKIPTVTTADGIHLIRSLSLLRRRITTI